MAVQELPEANRPFESGLLDILSMPVLVLYGAHSRTEFKNSAHDLAKRLTDARLVEIAGAGHIGPLTAPEAIADDLAGFFSG